MLRLLPIDIFGKQMIMTTIKDTDLKTLKQKGTLHRLCHCSWQCLGHQIGTILGTSNECDRHHTFAGRILLKKTIRLSVSQPSQQPWHLSHISGCHRIRKQVRTWQFFNLTTKNMRYSMLDPYSLFRSFEQIQLEGQATLCCNPLLVLLQKSQTKIAAPEVLLLFVDFSAS